ncbi:hypothetical protein KI387_018230, partial [Taxus chinensis]
EDHTKVLKELKNPLVCVTSLALGTYILTCSIITYSIATKMSGLQNQRKVSVEGDIPKEICRMFWKGNVKFEDIYSFKVEGSIEEANVMNEVRQRVKEQARVWWSMEAAKGAGWYLQAQYWKDNGNFVLSLSISTLKNTIVLKRLIRQGIPPVLRPNLWFMASGAAKKRSTVPHSYYQDLIRAVEGMVTPSTLQIDQDLSRTFPTHPWLDTEEGHASLRRILVAYSFRDSHVGYCQGLNFVAALLLLVMQTEEDAFWMLAVLLENVLFNDCYADNLFGSHVEQMVFKDFLAKMFPRLARHLEKLDFDVSLVATEWFLCLFAKSLPSETTMRIWDVLFSEGTNVLFRVALAIFKINEDQLLAAEQVGDVISILRHSAHHAFDPDALLKVAFEKIGSMTTNCITKHRKRRQAAVTAELDKRLRRLSSWERDKLSSELGN